MDEQKCIGAIKGYNAHMPHPSIMNIGSREKDQVARTGFCPGNIFTNICKIT